MGPVLYLAGTLGVWIGLALGLRAAALAVRAWQAPPGLPRAQASRGAAIALGLGALLTVVGSELTRPAERAGLSVPLVWLFMPFSAWVALAAFVAAAFRLGQAMLEHRVETRRQRFLAGSIWAVAACASFLWFRSGSDPIDVLRGAIAVSPATLGLVALLAVAAVGAMAWSGRSAKRRGWGKTAVAHVALIAGSIVFGLPFLWLTITSFKEDRDMASPTGIVWVPRVQLTVPYYDREDPLLEGDYEGTTVQGSVLETLPDGRVKLDILRPMALRGLTFETPREALKEVPKQIPLVTGTYQGTAVTGKVVQELDDGSRRVAVMKPPALAGAVYTALPNEVEPLRKIGLRWQNYTEALDFLPVETLKGLVYLKNTLILVVLNVLGTLLSCSLVAYAFSRMRFPGRDALFALLLSTMMLPAAVTLLPQFLIFRWLGWIDTLYPLWVPAFFASAFNVFLLRQFFMNVPMELEDAAKIDGCGYLRSYWAVMLPQVKPALAVIAIWTFMAAWNNFMGPLIYVNSPENMPVAYAVQLFQGDRGGEPGLLMAFTTLSMLPVLLLFFFAQRYFIEGVTLSGFGGR
ncbi:MAG: carbohydrate ABC transporter permease [Fimbriimonadaceae bacterium]|nr:carbohydrate ABC transporter permease [Chthonomonadaceae bacterium]MCO5295643.1 carbohydrate ABC transporter permease [Fimbriimonadaceae bacterium]